MAEILLMTTLKVEELQSIITNTVSAEFKKLLDLKVSSNEKDKLFTRQQTAKFLNISLPTLLVYTKKGKINAHRIGRRILFKESDINSAVEKINVGHSNPNYNG